MGKDRYYIGLDLGTSSVKGILWDGENIVASSKEQTEYKDSFLTPSVHYTGIDAEKFYMIICTVIKKLIDNIDVSAIKGIAMASASGNTILCAANGKPLIDAYSWTNDAMEEEVGRIFSKEEVNEIPSVSGWQFFYTFPIAHIAHIKANRGELLSEAACICSLTEYVIYRLTGKWLTDFSTATPFYLADQRKRQWHMPFLQKLGITEAKLPRLLDSGSGAGCITKSAACETGLCIDTQVCLGSFDHPSAARANGVTVQGQLLISCGTSWVCFFPVNEREKVISEGLLCDPFLQPLGAWGAMMSLSQIGTVMNGLVEKYISTESDMFTQFNSLSEKAEKGAGGLKIDLYAVNHGEIIKYSRENIARAIMEGVADILKAKLDKLGKNGFQFFEVVMAGGPSDSKIFRTVLSYVLEMPVSVKYGAYSGAVGAAKLCAEAKA